MTRVTVVAHGTKTEADGSDGLRAAVQDAVHAAGWPAPEWLSTSALDRGAVWRSGP